MKKSYLIAIIAAVVVIALAVVLIVGLGADKNDGNDDESATKRPIFTTPASPSTTTSISTTTTSSTTANSIITPVPVEKELEFELDDTGTAYTVVGIGTYDSEIINIPSTYKGKPVTCVAANAFRNNANIDKVVIPEGVERIEGRAFESCSNLANIVIPSSVTFIGENAFSDCAKLNIAEYGGSYTDWAYLVKDSRIYNGTNITRIVCDGTPIDLPEDKTVTIWVSTNDGMKEFTEEQIADFINQHPEYAYYDITVLPVSDYEVSSQILKDVQNAPDIYCFTQDALPRLVEGGAILELDSEFANAVSSNNDPGSVNVATVNDTLYAFPMASNNGYFLFYDSRYISDYDARTLEGIIAACEASNKDFGYNLSNSWTAASFFFAQPIGTGVPLCVSNWVYSNEQNGFIGYEDTFNSYNGMIALRAIQNLRKSSAWTDSDNVFDGTAAMVSGIWNINVAESEYGDYMKATKLPTFSVDGMTYQLGSFSGYNLMGVKPQDETIREEMLLELASYLTSEEAQLGIYYEFMWGPTNLSAQENPDVTDNMCLNALLSQNAYSQSQGLYPVDWWDAVIELVWVTQDPWATDSDFSAALQAYQDRIDELVQ